MSGTGVVVGCVILAAVALGTLLALAIVRGGQLAERHERARWTR